MNSPCIIPGAAVVVLALAVGGATPPAASAEQYNLRSCAILALKNTLATETARTNLKAAQADITGARSGFLPQVGLNGRWVRSEDERLYVTGGEPIFSDQAVTGSGQVSLNIFDGFGTWNRWRGAKHGRDSAEDRYLETRQAVVYETEVRYVEVLKQLDLFEVSNQALEVSSEQLKKTEAMRELGASTLADVYKAQVDHQNNILTQITTERDVRVAKASLLTWMGLDPRTEIELEQQDPWEDVPYTLDEAVERARGSNPSLKAAAASVSAFKHEVRAARSNYFPSIDIAASGDYTNFEFGQPTNENTFWQYGIFMNWNVFDGLLTKASVNRAQSSLTRTERELIDTERNVLFVVTQAWYDLEVARRAIDVAELTVRSSEEDHRLASERFRIGEGTILDVIDANVNLTRARADFVSSNYAARVFAAALRNAIGELPVPEPEDIQG